MALQDARDLLQYDLSVMLNAERQILQMLPLLAGETEDTRIRSGFAHHETQTRQQIENLERCCKLLHFQPQDLLCQTIAGLQQDHAAFKQQQPAPEVQTLFDLGAALKTEHFEIACYRGLISKATLLDQTECADLLSQNLAQEEEMARQLEELAPLEGRKAMMASGQSAGRAGGGTDSGGHTRRNQDDPIVEGSQSAGSITPPDTLRHPTEARLEEAGISPGTAQAQREEAGDVR